MDRSRRGAGPAKAPKHLWRQPRTRIRIQQRFHSDTEKYLRSAEGPPRPALRNPRMSWPSSLHRRRPTCTLSRGFSEPPNNRSLSRLSLLSGVSGTLGNNGAGVFQSGPGRK
uniref:Uncharacterized protein n=1 Tax=Sphaerodactylus townsendi TaxID=933632 RepID=A0ACB8F196_9SAUR